MFTHRTRHSFRRCLSCSVQDPTQHAHAMRFILDFRRSSTVITDSVHILQTSRIIEAVFEAAVALRLACLNDWRQQVKAHEKVELRQWLAQYLVQHSASGLTGPSIAVMSTLRVAHACMLKRLWLESGAVQGAAAVHVCFLCLQISLNCHSVRAEICQTTQTYVYITL